MARPLRVEFPGAIYHVTSRGDRREAIYDDDADRQAFLDICADALDRFDATLLAYCLMGNHYHLVLHSRLANLSRIMRQINGVYSQSYNRRHRKVGHLFQGRFKAIFVDRDAYLLEVCRYVELNPVRAHMVAAPADWPWSSYRANTGEYEAPAWLDTHAMLGYLLGRTPSSPEDVVLGCTRYATMVAEGKNVRLWESALRQQIYLGDDQFITRIQALLNLPQQQTTEIPRIQRRGPTKSVREYLDSYPRNRAVFLAYHVGRHTISAIAQEVGLSAARISRIVAKQKRIRSETGFPSDPSSPPRVAPEWVAKGKT